VDPVPDPLLLRKSGRAGNRTRDLWICSQELWPLDHRYRQNIQLLKLHIFVLSLFTNMIFWNRQLKCYIGWILGVWNVLIQFTLFQTGKFNSKVEPSPGTDCVPSSKLHCILSRDSEVGIAIGYKLNGRGVGVWVPVRERFFSSPLARFPGVKRLGREADNWPQTSAVVKNTWIYTSTPPYVFLV
jgi:hypothetical protein